MSENTVSVCGVNLDAVEARLAPAGGGVGESANCFPYFLARDLAGTHSESRLENAGGGHRIRSSDEPRDGLAADMIDLHEDLRSVPVNGVCQTAKPRNLVIVICGELSGTRPMRPL